MQPLPTSISLLCWMEKEEACVASDSGITLNEVRETMISRRHDCPSCPMFDTLAIPVPRGWCYSGQSRIDQMGDQITGWEMLEELRRRPRWPGGEPTEMIP